MIVILKNVPEGIKEVDVLTISANKIIINLGERESTRRENQ